MKKWHKRKRLEAAIAGELVDRVPVALWRHWPGDDQDAQALAAAHLKWQQDWDWDFLKVGPASSYSVADWGVETEWVGHIEGTRQYTHRPIENPFDWEKLEPLDPGQGMLAQQVETLWLLQQALQDEVPVIATVFSPLSQAKHLAGNERMLAHMREDPDRFNQALEIITESTVRFIEAAKETGISGIYYAVQHARFPLLNREEFIRFGREYDLRSLAAASDLWLNVLHIHSTDIMFDLIADYPVSVVNWHDRETGWRLTDGLQWITGAASGGIDHWTLHQEEPSQLLAEARDALNQTDSRRLILGTGCVAMVTTPLRNIRALRTFVDSEPG